MEADNVTILPSPAKTDAAPLIADSITQDIFCQDCGYNLRGLTGNRCPECGRSLEGLRSEVCKIPWVHRKEIGRFRAYWKTVWFVMFRQKEFCDEMARPVSYRDSQRFRWLTITLAFVPVLIADLILWVQSMSSPTDNEFITLFWSNLGLAATLHLGFLMFLVAATGLPSYFFHPKDVPVALQNRSIALSYYASGPISLLFSACVAALIWLQFEDSQVGLLSALLTFILPIALFGMWWIDLDHLSLRLLPQQRLRAFIIALSLPLLWLLFYVLTVGIVSFLALYIAIIINSVI